MQSRALWMCHACRLTVVFLLWPRASVAQDDREILIEAARETREAKTAIVGKGTARLTMLREQPPHDVTREAHVDLAFDRGRFRLEMEYVRGGEPTLGATRQVAVADSTGLFAATFSDRIQPWKAEANCLPVDKIRRLGFSFNPANMEEAFDLEEFLTGEWAKDFTVTPLENEDGYRAVFRPAGATVYQYYEALAENGYNVSYRAVRMISDDRELETWRAKWRNDNGWRIEAASFLDSAERDEYVGGLFEFVFDELRVVDEVADARFSIDSLGLPQGALITDRRPGAPLRQYQYTKVNEAKGEDLDLVVEQAKLPPAPGFEPREPRPASAWSRQGVYWLIGGALVAVGLIVLLTRRKSPHA